MAFDFNAPNPQAAFPLGPGANQGPLTIAGFAPPFQSSGLGAIYDPEMPQVGPAMPQIQYGAVAGVPTLDHLPGIQNGIPEADIYGG